MTGAWRGAALLAVGLALVGGCRTSTPSAHAAEDAARRALIEALLADGAPSEGDIIVRVWTGSLDTVRMSASVAGAYPGAQLRTAVLWGGERYGLGAGSLGDLARRRGWLEAPPDPAALAELVCFGWLPGMAPAPDATPRLDGDPRQRVLHFEAIPTLGAGRVRVRAELSASGAGDVMTEPAAPATAPRPPDALAQALDAGDAGAILEAIGRGDGDRTPRWLELLARAAGTPNEAIAGAALLAAGDDEAALRAVLGAWRSYDDGAREQIRALSGELLGADFASQLPPPEP